MYIKIKSQSPAVGAFDKTEVEKATKAVILTLLNEQLSNNFLEKPSKFRQRLKNSWANFKKFWTNLWLTHSEINNDIILSK